MNQIHKKYTLLTLSLLSVNSTAFAASTDEKIENLNNRINHLEQKVQKQNAIINNKENTPLNNIQISGLIEVETFVSNPESGGSESDTTLATVELGLAAEITENLSAEVVFLFEEDETDLEIDTAEFTYAFSNTPISITAGQIYVPFGQFETSLVSDPLTLEIGETRETTLKLNYEKGAISGSVYTFNGDINRNGDSDIENWGANLAYSANGLDIGLGYINNLGDSDTIQDTITNPEQSNFSDGFTANITYSFGAFTLIGEYLGALDGFSDATFNGAEPSATNIEVDYSINILGKPATLIAAYQTTDDSLALELPETKLLLGLGIEFNDNFGVVLEYSNAEDYDLNEGGTGEDTDTFVAQLALNF